MRISSFFLVLWVVLSIVSVPGIRAEDEVISIVCTNSVLADFTTNIIHENVTLDYIMPAGVCPAHFDTSPSDILKIVSADIIISLGWEPWLVHLLNKSGNTQYGEIKCLNLGEWNIPSHARTYVETIRDGLLEILPNRSRSITQEASSYIAQINTTEQQLQNLIENAGFVGRKIISMEWQKDFILGLGLNVTYFYASPESLSVQDELAVFEAASQDGVVAVVDNLQSGADFGARVAAETGVSHVIFTNFPGAIPGADTYLEMISYNADQLIKGIQTYDQLSDETMELKNQVTSLTLQRNTFVVISVIAFLVCLILFALYKRKEKVKPL